MAMSKIDLLIDILVSIDSKLDELVSFTRNYPTNKNDMISKVQTWQRLPKDKSDE
jgi:hypothetical protein